MHRKKHISKPWNLKLNLFEKNLLFWSWLCKHQDEEICSLGRWISYQGSKRKKIKTDSWDLLETNNNSPLLKRIWFLHLRFVARSRNLEQVIDCCFPGKSHLFSRQLSHCNFFGKLLTQRPIGYKTQWFDQKSLWQKRNSLGLFCLVTGQFLYPVFGKKEMMLEIFEIVTAFEKEMWRHCAELVNYFRASADKLTDESHPIMKCLQHFFNTLF